METKESKSIKKIIDNIKRDELDTIINEVIKNANLFELTDIKKDYLKSTLYHSFAIDVLEFMFDWRPRWYDFINPFSIFRFRTDLSKYMQNNWVVIKREGK